MSDPPDCVWKEAESQMVFSYRIHNEINIHGNPIFIIQRREIGRHHVGYWKNYSLRVFQENERDEAIRILKHLEGETSGK
jgi:hypothetical protein